MIERNAWLRFLRLAAITALTLYVVVFGALLAFQRDMLFFGGRYPAAPGALYHVHTIAEQDGTRIAVWDAVPRRADAPVIVFFYGNAGTLSDFAAVGEAFHDEGFGVVLASYRGYPGNSGTPSEDGVMADARAILAGVPKGHPIILWGQSLGSGVAARMASEGRCAALILQSPYTAVADVAARRFPIYPVHWVMRDPFNTLALVPKIKVPVLIMHGTADGVVPFDMGETLAHALGAEATFVPIQDGGHNLSGDDVQPIADAWLRAQGRAIRGRGVVTGRR